MNTVKSRGRRNGMRRKSARAGITAALALAAITAGGGTAFAAEGPQVMDVPADSAGNISVEGVPFRTAVPGKPGFPAVKITNRGGSTVDSLPIDVRLDSDGLSWPFTELFKDSDGERVAMCELDEKNRKMMHCDAELNLHPGQSITLRTEVDTADNLKPGELPRTQWKVDGHGETTAEVTMVEGDAAR
ncbi:hypothetical protein [Streptomyces marispadix]|uniref:Uncharacterized protein n=1 Tax=Streptomyces marispadix TaxID=2922868 RepID=A0ABS9SX60_9ACTN|nr:hypothetical protein [Streptomyces marispadix]MCH6160840.1 hypothetical protein [Streptomyces marispadix]